MRVLILMSTYNGEKYIAEQINSILNQLPNQSHILIRDDGSNDNTKSIIQSFSDPRIELIEGNNIGFCKSFLKLLAFAPPNYDIFMLSDQDDIWQPDKIKRATTALTPYLKIPALYCTRMELVDKDLNHLGLSALWPNPPSFYNALTENIVTGCTSAITLPLKKLAVIPCEENNIFFHDWWLYLVGAAFGSVIFDTVPTIQYRQHQNNVIGMKHGINRYISIAMFIIKTSWTKILENQLTLFQSYFSHRLPEDKKNQLLEIINSNGKLRRTNILFSKNLHRQLLFGEIMLRLLLTLDHRK